MGRITIEAYGKVQYDKELPDNVCFAIFKEREKQDKEYEEKAKAMKQ
jgi:hypothetical protein